MKDGICQTFEVEVEVLDDTGAVIQTSIQKLSLITVKEEKVKIVSTYFDNLQELAQK